MQYRSPEQPICEDFVFHASDDQRPNTGLREGLIHHSDVNETIRMECKGHNFRPVDPFAQRRGDARRKATPLPRRVEFADSARVLINTGEGFFAKPDPAEETKHLCSILTQLDLHPLFHTQFLQQYRKLSGNGVIVLKALIAPETERAGRIFARPAPQL